MAHGKKIDQERIDAAERRQQALALRKQGESYRAIGAQLNISEAQAHRDVQAALQRLAKMELASADELRTMELARLDALVVEAWGILMTDHPYVAGGKVLADLTDDGPKLAAIDRLRQLSESRRKLLGLDAPAKVAPTNPDGTPYETHQQMIGLVLNLLAPYPDLRLALAAQLTEDADGVQDEPGDGA